MNHQGLLAGLLLAVGVATSAACAQAATVSGGRYGEAIVSQPRGPMRGFVVLFSASTGWTAADQQAADRLSQQDMLVVGVDTARYAATLAAIQEACHHLVGDAEAISHQLQRELGGATYFTPIIAGAGEGGLLAEQLLSAAPSNTIGGAISVDPAPTLDSRFNPCPPDPNMMHDRGLPGFWALGTTATLAAPVQSLVARLRQDGARLVLQDFPSGTTESSMLLALSEPHLGSRAPDEGDISDLPLVELPAANATNMLAIVISGDGGWRDLDKTIARDLQGWGVSVVGLDSLRYFWSKRTPEQTANDLTRIIRFYTAHWHARSIALIGYSFGADVLPFVYNRLPARERDEVALLALLGFARAADFEIRVTGWLGMPPSSAALPVQSEIAKVPPTLVQCFYGEDEDDTVCPELRQLRMAVIRTSGGHHFGHDYERLARTILEKWRLRLTQG
jgi:type IV secretory pathway VirJ component